jgi:hypothetical protein
MAEDAPKMKDLPRWAKSCPNSFGEMQAAIVTAATFGGQMRLTPQQMQGFSQALGHVAATCFAAGIKSVKESNGATASLEGMG